MGFLAGTVYDNCLRKGVLLLADHQNRKRTGYRCALASTAPAWWWRRCRATLLRHGEQVARLAVERHGAGAIHRFQVLLDIETGRALFLDDGHRAVAMCAERFH